MTGPDLGDGNRARVEALHEQLRQADRNLERVTNQRDVALQALHDTDLGTWRAVRHDLGLTA